MLLIYGLQHGLIIPYDDKLIGKLRNVYYGKIPYLDELIDQNDAYIYDRDKQLSLARRFLKW